MVLLRGMNEREIFENKGHFAFLFMHASRTPEAFVNILKIREN